MTLKSTYCRTCFCVLQGNCELLRRRPLMHNIFDNRNFTKKLILCSNTHIRPYDQFPNFICQTCYEKVLHFYEFQLMCRESLKMFNELQKCDNDFQKNLDDIQNYNTNKTETPYVVDTKENNYYQETEDTNGNNAKVLCQEIFSPKMDDNYGVNENRNDSDIPSETETLSISYQNNIKQIDALETITAVNSISNLLNETDENLDSIIDNVFMNQDTILNEVDVYTTYENSENIEDNLYGLLIKNETKLQTDQNTKVSDPTYHHTEDSGTKDSINNEEQQIEETAAENNEPKRVIREGLRSQNKAMFDADNHRIPTHKRNLRYYCNICSKLFRFLHHLEAHKRKDHQGLPAYQCKTENCIETFDRFNDLRDHLLKHDGIEPTVFRCEHDDCDREFPRRNGLALHMARAHNYLPKRQNHTCDVCGKVFKQLHKLREHSYIHKDKSTWLYTCDYEGCQKKCRTWTDMNQHKMRHTITKRFNCPYCGAGKTTAHELKIHINFHTLERTWPCDQCPKVCKTLANLKRHTSNKHSGSKKQFKCSFCNATFGTKEVMKSHEKNHTSDRPYVCNECGKGFIWAYRLKMHLKTHLASKEKKKVSAEE